VSRIDEEIIKKRASLDASLRERDHIYAQVCSKIGCGNHAVDVVYGSCMYYPCEEHLAEIIALVDSE